MSQIWMSRGLRAADGTWKPTFAGEVFDSPAPVGLPGAAGEPGPQGDPGPPGYSLPPGGTAGQVLVKKSGTDWDVEWRTVEGLGTGEASYAGVLFVDKAATGEGDGTSWADAFTAIQDAIEAASESGGAYWEVWVKGDGNTYYPDEGDRPAQWVAHARGYCFTPRAGITVRGIWTTSRPALSGDLGRDADNAKRAYKIIYAAALDWTCPFVGFDVTGAYLDQSSSTINGAFGAGAAYVLLVDCVVHHNHAIGGGGGMYGGRILRCVVENNTCGNSGTYPGGAGLSSSSGYDSVVQDNTQTGSGGDGGGLRNGTYHRCIIRRNATAGRGGGTMSPVSMVDCLIVDNVAGGDGGASYHGSDTDFINCTIAGNTAASTAGCYNGALKNCLALNANASVTTSSTMTSGDPKFVDAANGDYRLAADSPCIDAGSNANRPTNDVRRDCGGLPRIVNTTVDQGCHEYQGA
jgi:hypothetical protein